MIRTRSILSFSLRKHPPPNTSHFNNKIPSALGDISKISVLGSLVLLKRAVPNPCTVDHLPNCPGRREAFILKVGVPTQTVCSGPASAGGFATAFIKVISSLITGQTPFPIVQRILVFCPGISPVTRVPGSVEASIRPGPKRISHLPVPT